MRRQGAFKPEPPPAGRFRPGREAEPKRPEARGFFRKTFHLARVPERAPARITADSRYLLFVNGQEVYRGPIRSQPRRLTYDFFDLTPYLRPGENTLAVYVVYYGTARSFWQPAVAGSALGRNGMLVFEANLGPQAFEVSGTSKTSPSEDVWLVSDASWKALKSDAWSEDWKKAEELPPMFGDAIPTEVVDARWLPFGWEQPDFDDSAWGNTYLVSPAHPGSGGRATPPADPYGPLYPRPIGKLGGDLRLPVTVRGEYLAGTVDTSIGDPMLRLQTVIPIAGAAAIVSGLAPRERWPRIIATITDPTRLVVRSWTGGESGDYSIEKMQKQFMGIYEPDWDVEREIVIGEPFISYLVHDAVAEAGLADKLPDLYRRWSQFLTGGYDTIGECWGWGTHVHGWSCTPTKDMIFYTLGVTPAEPGYTTARIAPRLGSLAWAEGKVPTPYGLIHVRAEPGCVVVDSPVPLIIDLPGQAPRRVPAGEHIIST